MSIGAVFGTSYGDLCYIQHTLTEKLIRTFRTAAMITTVKLLVRPGHRLMLVQQMGLL